MENRERDRVSQRTSSTEAGEVNRRTEEQKGKQDGSVDFGKKIGKSEGFEDGSDVDSSTGRGSTGTMGSTGSIGQSDKGRH